MLKSTEIENCENFHVALVSDDELLRLRQAWGGLETTLPISHVRGEGYMELDRCPLTEDGLMRALHHDPDAWYTDRPFHISG